MRVLVTWGSKRGGTADIARLIADALRTEGFEVDARAAHQGAHADGFDAVIVGGALYAHRWHCAASRFVERRLHELRRVPVWFFSSGPLDDSSDRADIDATPQVALLMERVGALGHVTFGGRLAADAQGFPASAMAKKHAGDWRNQTRIRAWAVQLAHAIPQAHPGRAVDPKGGSLPRLVAHAVVGWVACAAWMGALSQFGSRDLALITHAFAAPLIFLFVARRYFRAHGARAALSSALAFVSIVALLDLVVVAGLLQRSLAMFGSVLGTWLPQSLIFAVTWATGEWTSLQPTARAPRNTQARA